MTIEADNTSKLSYNPRKSTRFSGPRKPEVFLGDKFEQRITFVTKVKSKSIALSGGIK